MHTGIQKSGIMLNVALAPHVFFAVIVKLKYVFFLRNFFVFFADHMRFQFLIFHFLLGHRSPVFETPVPRAHVIILAVGIGPVFQRVLQHGPHFWVGVQLIVFPLGQNHGLSFDVGLAVGGIRVIVSGFFGEKQDGLAFLQSVFKRVRIFQRLRCVCG